MYKYSFLLIFLFLISFPVPIRAAANFSTDLETYLILDASGRSVIKEYYTTTNLTSRYLISSYEYHVPGTTPENLKGSDGSGPILIQTQKISENDTLIRLIFNSVVAGKNRDLNFSLSHAGPDADFSNDLWKIVFPKFNNPESVEKYELKLKFPKSMGFLSSSAPPPVSFTPEERDGFLIYTFSKHPLITSGLTAFIGQFRLVDFNLSYPLSNLTNKSKIVILPLPSDSKSQKILINKYSQSPENVVSDDQGNWQLSLNLDPLTHIVFEVSGQAQLSPDITDIKFPANSKNLPRIIQAPSHTYSDSLPKVRINWIPPFQLLPLINNNGRLIITNSGSSAVYYRSLKADFIGIHGSIPISLIPVLPPGGSVTIPLSLRINPAQVFSPKYVSVIAGDTSVTYNLPDSLLYGSYIITSLIFSLSFLGAAKYAHDSWGLHLQKSRRSGHLHRQSQES